ncbi:CPBP family intramembrane metalloprotease [Phormidium sp. FACHB-592]|uniref:CPBP family intramembrane metalloprotease n=1 Tax=Stenomitos frigidus AS-A4 TaxID=2933935 RepID=A0ABV0KTX5_9CYAN|nr:type II CAAX endopeptidase family protein [Phormidium sp. FACHB-592]MBD2072352.1 CPBP family intramembrane metalloprotease [Phormidium sp. FACHB-592]
MSKVPSNSPQGQGKTFAAVSEQSSPNKPSRPGWLEIIVGLVVLGAIGIGGALLAGQFGLDPVVYGLVLAALSVIAPFAGFAAAALLRLRSWSTFGVRCTTARWLLIGAGAGVVAFVVRGFAAMAYTALTGDSSTPQEVYGDAGSGGALSLVLATLFIGLLVPLVEELLFRGVVTNALLRYGPFIGVVGSTLIFALAHGVNIVFAIALVFGLVSAELFRRSGSIWPGVIAHVINNLPTVFVLMLIRAA